MSKVKIASLLGALLLLICGSDAFAVYSGGSQISTAPGLSTYSNSAVATVVNRWAIMSSTGATAALTTTTRGLIGICVSNCGTSGVAAFTYAGQAPCDFDGTPTNGDYVTLSTTTAGECHDAGASYPGGLVIGQVVSGSGNPYTIALSAIPNSNPANTVPPMLSWFGDGALGAVNLSTTATLGGGENDYTTFICGSATPFSLTCTQNRPCIIRATISIALNSGCTIDHSGANAGQTIAITAGTLGGSGGGSGGGTAAGAGGEGIFPWGNNGSFSAWIGGGTAGASSGGNGGNGNAWSTLAATQQNQLIYDQGTSGCFGGGAGKQGGSSGGLSGNAGGCIWLIAPSVTIASGATVTVAGGNGANSGANSTGAGSGGGGGFIGIAARSITQSGTLTTTGGTGGSCLSFTGCGTGGNGGAGGSVQLTIP